MDLGLHLLHAGPPATAEGIFRIARAAEHAGYSTLWLFDHLMTPVEQTSVYPFDPEGAYPLSPEDPYFEPVATIAALAGATHRIGLGTRVLVPVLRSPVVLAKQLATIDALAGGRVTVGIGAGWMEDEFRAVGLDPARRFARMEEHLAVMRGIWREGVTEFTGEFYAHARAGFHPRPPRGDIPVIIGGYSDGALRRVARHGDGWAAIVRNEETIRAPHVAASPAAMAERIGLLHRYCEEEGRDPDELRIVAAVSPRDDPATLEGYAEIGVDECDVMVFGSVDRVEVELERFANAVGLTISPTPAPTR